MINANTAETTPILTERYQQPDPHLEINQLFNQSIRESLPDLDQDIDVATILTDILQAPTQHQDQIEAVLLELGAEPRSKYLHNTARALMTALTPSSSPQEIEHNLGLIRETFWPEIIASSRNTPNVAVLKDRLAPKPALQELDSATLNRLHQLVPELVRTDTFQNILQTWRLLDPGRADAEFFAIISLRRDSFISTTDQAEVILATSEIPESRRRLVSRLLLASTHTFSDRKFTPESQQDFAKALDDELLLILANQAEQSHLKVDRQYQDEVIEALDILPQDSISERLRKMSSNFDKLLIDPATAHAIGINPQVGAYHRTTISRAPGSINHDYPGFPLEGGVKYIRRNQAIEISQGNSTYIAVITGDENVSSADSWRVTIIDGDGNVLPENTVKQMVRLRIKKEHERSYSQLSSLNICSKREIPVQLLRAALGLPQKEIDEPYRTTLPYLFPKISQAELNSALPPSPLKT